MTALSLYTAGSIGANAYLPDRSPTGKDSLEDLIKNLAARIVIDLDEMQAQTQQEMQKCAVQDDIKVEAHELFGQIEALKQRLLALSIAEQ